ncbi:META domain-containing protein [Spirosoma soli]|uniref:META domain-containing protein n=1 Tax=Spirosoma soli TaxID=1770529 RepID=A0ABW5MAD8_9BACT
MYKSLVSLLLITTLLYSFSCERNEEVVPADTQQLVGSWKLLEPGAFNVTLVVEPVVQTWERLPDKAFNLSGESAVNIYSSRISYEAPDQRTISIAPIISTKRGGPSEAMQFEQLYFANLMAVNRYELTGSNQLRLYYGGDQPGVLVYEKIK